MSMKVTFEKLSKVLICVKSINSNDKDGRPINDRLSWAIQRWQEKNEANLKKMTTEETDNSREYASVDEKTKIFISDANGGLQFTKENLKKSSDAMEKFKTTQTCEMETYVCKDISRSSLLPLWIQKELDGIVLTMDPKLKAFAAEEEAENGAIAAGAVLEPVVDPVELKSEKEEAKQTA